MTQEIKGLSEQQFQLGEQENRAVQTVLKEFEVGLESQSVLPGFFGKEVGSVVISQLKNQPFEISLK